MSWLGRCITLLFLVTVSIRAGDVPSHKLFADGLTAKLYVESNECSSALGVSMCFGLVYPGARGDCASQIKSTLHYPDSVTQTSLVWGATTNRITAAYDGKCTRQFNGKCEAKNPMLQIANSIWINGGTMVSEYANIVGGFSRNIDFRAQNAGSLVNEWCSNKTYGLIPSILDEGPIQGDLVAVNAIYLNATWLHEFADSKTNKDVFYTSGARKQARTSPAHFMHIVEELPYANLNNDHQVLQLHYTSSSLSMLIALPRAESVSTLSSEAVLGAVNSGALKKTRVAVALPKFQFRSEYSGTLKTALQELGMVAPFKGGFTGMLENKELMITKTIQKTFINVYEKGTEAAAVTAIVMKVTSAIEKPPDPILYRADHPFQFWIYDSQEDVVLFEGRVGDPGIVEGTTSRLSHVHQDADFWKRNFNVEAVINDRASSPVSVASASCVVAFAASLVFPCLMHNV